MTYTISTSAFYLLKSTISLTQVAYGPVLHYETGILSHSKDRYDTHWYFSLIALKDSLGDTDNETYRYIWCNLLLQLLFDLPPNTTIQG